MSRLKCRKGCDAILLPFIINSSFATDIPVWQCSICTQWLYSAQVRFAYVHQMYVPVPPKPTLDEYLVKFLREGAT
jgi:hypothetical protein